jgi:ADP-heptose:LPS heptosyltransferase
MSRLAHRTRVVLRALQRRGSGRNAPQAPERILLAHQLLLGDTLMTTGLVAKLRQQFPQAELSMVMPPAFLPLYQGQPFGLRALPFRPDRPDSFAALCQEAPFDWALLPGDNRFSWLAQALDARWITGWENDRPASKNWLVDDPQPWPAGPGSLVDLWAGLIAGAPPPPFRPDDWPAPAANPFDRPQGDYAVLHVGASNPRKFWPAKHWQALAEGLQAKGLSIVLSGGKGEEALAQACNPDARWLNLAGRLDLAQMWHLLKGARLLVAPDTGIAHLGKVTGTPTLALFGAGPTPLYARGEYFQHQPFHCAVLSELPARPQNTLFKRGFSWLPALSSQRHTAPDIHYGQGAEFVLELAERLLVHTLD